MFRLSEALRGALQTQILAVTGSIRNVVSKNDLRVM
jgi:hypothetical protein